MILADFRLVFKLELASSALRFDGVILSQEWKETLLILPLEMGWVGHVDKRRS